MDEETIDKVPPSAVDRALTIDKVPSPAVDRALTILEKLVESRSPMTLTALAAEAGIPLATCAAIMQTFEARGYAARRVVGRSHFWRLTLKLNGLVSEYMRGIDLGQVVQPHLQELVGQTQMAAHVGLLEGDMIVYAAKAAAGGLVQFDTYPGKMTPFNLTALGQAVVAYLPEDQIEPLLAHLVPGAGPGARQASTDDMRARLAKVRERGYAVEDEEEEAGVGCIAAPFFDPAGQVLGSVGVTGFADQVRGTRLRRNAGFVVGASRRLSQEFSQGLDVIGP
jgi:IclR family transcriptional regulator, KDG regulon repressor